MLLFWSLASRFERKLEVDIFARNWHGSFSRCSTSRARTRVLGRTLLVVGATSRAVRVRNVMKALVSGGREAGEDGGGGGGVER